MIRHGKSARCILQLDRPWYRTPKAAPLGPRKASDTRTADGISLVKDGGVIPAPPTDVLTQ